MRGRPAARTLHVMTHDEPLRGQIRLAGYTRQSHGLYLPPGDLADDRERFVRTLLAWLLVLPPDAVFTHLTAAKLLGWWLPAVPEFVPVFAATRDLRRPRRPGLICSRLTHVSVGLRSGELPIDSPVEILLRCARDLGVLDVTVLIDSALRLAHVTHDEIRDMCATRRPGVRVLRAALNMSDARSASPWESMLRIFHQLAGVPVEPQRDLYDSEGRFVARVDLLVTGTTLVHEYDGADHRRRPQHRADLRRERRLAETPYVRRGFTAEDLVRHPLVMLQEIDRALGRRHRPQRLTAWRLWLQESLYGELGRERVLTRWRRNVGRNDWAHTA